MDPETMMGRKYWISVIAIAVAFVVFLAVQFVFSSEGRIHQFLIHRGWTHIEVTDYGNATGIEGCDKTDESHFYVTATDPNGRDQHILVCCKADETDCEIKHP